MHDHQAVSGYGSRRGTGAFPDTSQRREQPWTVQLCGQSALLQQPETGRLSVRLTQGFCENHGRRGSRGPSSLLVSGSDRHVVSADLRTGRALITSAAPHVTDRDAVVWGGQATQGEPAMITAGEEGKFLRPLKRPRRKASPLPWPARSHQVNPEAGGSQEKGRTIEQETGPQSSHNSQGWTQLAGALL